MTVDHEKFVPPLLPIKTLIYFIFVEMFRGQLKLYKAQKPKNCEIG